MSEQGKLSLETFNFLPANPQVKLLWYLNASVFSALFILLLNAVVRDPIKVIAAFDGTFFNIGRKNSPDTKNCVKRDILRLKLL